MGVGKRGARDGESGNPSIPTTIAGAEYILLIATSFVERCVLRLLAVKRSPPRRSVSNLAPLDPTGRETQRIHCCHRDAGNRILGADENRVCLTCADQNSTVVFPLPVDIITPFLRNPEMLRGVVDSFNHRG